MKKTEENSSYVYNRTEIEENSMKKTTVVFFRFSSCALDLSTVPVKKMKKTEENLLLYNSMKTEENLLPNEENSNWDFPSRLYTNDIII